ncbi:hypothetical protein KIPB_016546, partial [Kipferlia bialata]|eukprot:g16546.t1
MLPYDVIVGGLAWCCMMSNFDLDLDFEFDVTATIKNKIKVGERIGKALRNLKCPHPLQ